jgi:hypothetical protein
MQLVLKHVERSVDRLFFSQTARPVVGKVLTKPLYAATN